MSIHVTELDSIARIPLKRAPAAVRVIAERRDFRGLGVIRGANLLHPAVRPTAGLGCGDAISVGRDDERFQHRPIGVCGVSVRNGFSFEKATMSSELVSIACATAEGGQEPGVSMTLSPLA
jgi:hypothetical protein